MSFKKNGTNPGFDMPQPALPGLPGGAAWPAWVANAARAVQEYVAAAMNAGRAPEQPEDHLRYRRSRGRPEKHRRPRNMLHVSKRVRRKHRRARGQ